MLTEQLLWYGIAEFFFSISPGPAVFLVVSLALRQGFGHGASAALGIVGVNLLYFALSAAGVGALLVASPNLFLALKIIGAAYLTWVAAGIFLGLWREWRAPAAATTEAPAAMPAPTTRRDLFMSLMKGVAVQASNMKNIMLFLAIIPQFVVPEAGNVGLQFMGLAVVSVLVELPILLAYAMLAARLGQTLRTPRVRQWLDALSATVLLAIAGSILRSTR